MPPRKKKTEEENAPKVKKVSKRKLKTVLTRDNSEYINGDPKYGIKIDWTLVRRAYRALNCPPEFFDPTLRPIDMCKYLLEISRRGTGKTTGILLLGMILFQIYGITTCYIRQNYDMIAEKTVSDMMQTIIRCGYIQNITDNKWNYAFYHNRRWFYCNVDEDGNIVERSNQHFIFMCDILHAKQLKSGFADNQCDHIIFDEFINDDVYYPNEFVKFCDLLCTIIRERRSPIIWMVSNNIDKESPYFHEMGCYEIIRAMCPGDSETYTTEKGTKIFLEYFSPEKVNKQSSQSLKEMVSLFFGFNNPKLGAITGEDWAITPAPHIPEGKVDFVMRNLYISAHGRLVSLDIVNHEDLGLACYVHWATRVYEDSIILTTDAITDPRFVYGVGIGRLNKLLIYFQTTNRFYYAHNDVASFMRAYVKNIPNTI